MFAAVFAVGFAPSLPEIFVSKLLVGLSMGLLMTTYTLHVTGNAPDTL